MATKRAPVKALRWTQRLVITILLIALIYMFKPITKIDIIPSPRRPTFTGSISVKKGDLGLKYPQGIAVNPKNDWLYVTSAKNSRVFVFDKEYQLLFSFKEKLKVPVFIAVNKKGQAYITDRGQKAVLVFNQDGQFVKKLKLAGIDNPLAIAVDNKNNIYLSNTGKQHEILKYSPTGKLTLRFGYKKRAVPVTGSKGGFFFPNGLAVDKKQNIYVADSNNQRIQIFNKKGHFKKMVVTGGLPRGIALNEQAGVFFVADALRHKIHMHDINSGEQRSSFSQLGSSRTDVAFPNGIVVKGQRLGDILVVDRENGRIQIFKTRLSISDLAAILRPYLPLLPIPLLVLLLLFAASRRRRYIVADCFIDSVIKNKSLLDLIAASNAYNVSPGYFKILSEKKLISDFKGAINQNKRFNHRFAEKAQKSHKLTNIQAEALALAHHRGIYKPVLLACDKKLLDAAHDHGIQAMDLKTFFHLKKINN